MLNKIIGTCRENGIILVLKTKQNRKKVVAAPYKNYF